MATTEDLVNSLKTGGTAEHEINPPTFDVRAARARLIAAAQEAGVRVSVRRDHANNRMVATVLGRSQSLDQAHKGAFYSASNWCKKAIQTLQTDLRDPDQFSEIIADLDDIAHELQLAGDEAKR